MGNNREVGSNKQTEKVQPDISIIEDFGVDEHALYELWMQYISILQTGKTSSMAIAELKANTENEKLLDVYAAIGMDSILLKMTSKE